ncbi:MAG: hypothetical protein KY464_08920 [Gemmatimonadetes bacterium]|nr:hypothetical protein [Gemmatimonadota bacterium]
MVALLRALEIAVGGGAFLLVAYLLGTGAGIIPELEVRVLRGPGESAAEFLIHPVAANPPPPFELELADGEVIDLRTGDHFDAPFEVRDPRPCTLTAQVLGLAGGRRDVEVYVLDDDGYLDWQKGVRPRALFESGRATLTSLEVELPSRGRYHLLLSNRYSIFTPKTVRVDDARLRCA